MICNKCKLHKPKNEKYFKGYFNKTCKTCEELIKNGIEPTNLSKTHKHCSCCHDVLPKERFILNYTKTRKIVYSKQCDSCKPRKKCIDCGLLKSLSSYNKKGLLKSGQIKYDARCSDCRKIYRKKGLQINRRIKADTFLCNSCEEEKPSIEFYRYLRTETVRRGTCKSCQKRKCVKINNRAIEELRPWYVRSLLNSRFNSPIIYAKNQTEYNKLMKKVREKVTLERKIREEVEIIKSKANI